MSSHPSTLAEDRSPASEGAESLLVTAKRTLEMIARRASLDDILADLCTTIDAQSSGGVSMITLMDPDGRRLWPASGPRVPKEWFAALRPLAVGPDQGPCGAAAFRKQRVIVSDVLSDPLMDGLSDAQSRAAALRHGIRAAWSQPLLSRDDEVLGTFGMVHSSPRSPTARELRLIEEAGHLAVIAIEGERAQAALDRALADACQSERSLRTILDAIPTQAWSLHPDGRVDYLNQRWFEYTGLSASQVYGAGKSPGEASVFDVVHLVAHPDDVPRVVATWREMLKTPEPIQLEPRLRRHDGEYRHFSVRGEPVFDEAGALVHWYGTNTDIEDLKRAEAKLLQDQIELQRITDAIPQAIMVLSPEGSALYANRFSLEYLGLTLEELVGPHFRGRIIHPEDVARLRVERQRQLARGVPFENEQRFRRQDGQYRWFLVRYNALCDEQGHVVRWYATGTDIEDRKQTEDQMRTENLALREDLDRSSMFEEIVGSSTVLRRVLAETAKVARTDSTVLVLGETGTGKELIARAIHRRSRRAARPFIRVSCAAIPQSLVASELFGHERGAFTGALQRRLGRFEAANGGTIFLDEIGELPAETQVALLRVLQEREMERMGSNQPISLDVRVVAATNRDLQAAVERGEFREDLFYRLNVFPIRVPPLRERVEDVPVLVEYLVERYAKRAGKTIRHVQRHTLDLFQAYPWPGNVRELQNVIERAVVLCEGDVFAIDESWLKPATAAAPARAARPLTSLADGERELIEAALAASGGRISGPNGAAAKLGIPRQTLESKLKALKIDRLAFRSGAIPPR